MLIQGTNSNFFDDLMVRDPFLVMFLHGYGGPGQGSMEFAQLCQSFFPREGWFWMPNGLSLCEEEFGGYQWFSLKDVPRNPLGYQIEGIQKMGPTIYDSAEKALQKLEKQVQNLGIQKERVFVMGMSQGAMVAFHLGLYLRKVLGVLGYCGAFVPLSDSFLKIRNINHFKSPCFVAHGDQDDVLTPSFFEYTKTELAQLFSFDLECLRPQCCLIEGMGHHIAYKSLKLGLNFIKKQL